MISREAASHCFYLVSELMFCRVPVFQMQSQHSTLTKYIWVELVVHLNWQLFGYLHKKTLKGHQSLTSHLRVAAKTWSCLLLPQCVVVVTVCPALLSHKPPAHDLFIRCPVRAGGLFFESGWEIKILISSVGLLCCLQGRIYRLSQCYYIRCAGLASH